MPFRLFNPQQRLSGNPHRNEPGTLRGDRAGKDRAGSGAPSAMRGSSLTAHTAQHSTQGTHGTHGTYSTAHTAHTARRAHTAHQLGPTCGEAHAPSARAQLRFP